MTHDRPHHSEALTLDDMRIRDPYLVFDGEVAYLFGTTDLEPWLEGAGVGFDAYRSLNLKEWFGPIPAFRPAAGFWATGMFWAPEVHRYRDRWYMFATFAGPSRRRGTQVLVAESLEGPFEPWSIGPVTPAEWECLDGTLHVDDSGEPWIVFCQEWLQVGDGIVWAQRMRGDLRGAAGPPVRLFSASEAAWVAPIDAARSSDSCAESFITDGPFLHRTSDGDLLMLWSSHHQAGYAVGIARSVSGHVLGPWSHDSDALWDQDGGHAMIATLPDHSQVLAFHHPNDSPNERVRLLPLRERARSLWVDHDDLALSVPDCG